MDELLSNVYVDVDKLLKQYTENHFPTWKEFPDIPLYMDQVIELMERYLSVEVPGDEDEHEHKHKLLTSSMVNNYVKMGIMPAPVKKKYTREHLAYLVIICLMKQSLSISAIGLFIQAQSKAMGIEEFYNFFVETYSSGFAKYVNELRGINTGLRKNESAALGIQAIACANAGKLTCEATDSVMRNEVKAAEERKKAEKEAKEKAEKEAREREKAEKEAKEKAEKEAKEREKAEKE